MTEKLTPEQIQNWRKVLTGMFGPYAMIMSDDEVQKFKDKMQNNIDKNEKENENAS